ncbi:hypothetical protein HS088_TW20G00571 [Tripterygium wilfordii]|uniref:Protein LONGIFOLIA 1-like n=1 Tax=Tripterygium wilfordii TaxID=458696 RepID=A0A7J7C7T6_TRIWF|nr:protein LONGIFOLIA 1-like [Tripterygium wilfordii]XP_038687757.1 protein LONGIFOLIA 1-like [Tripterygium wilfordii]KAF5730199.1 hypothetical protein HS088_TW20G00571 [Tripterygium wilfordii]
MAAKLLHSLADENPDLQKQIGCMTGIFQIFDRHHTLTGRRLNQKRLPPAQGDYHLNSGNFEGESFNANGRQGTTDVGLNKGVNEKQRFSTESSRASFSSSCSSPSSTFDCNKTAQPETSSFDRTISHEAPLRDPVMNQLSSSPYFGRQSVDLRDVVKDSMNREMRGLQVKTKEEAVNQPVRHRDSPRPFQPSVDMSHEVGINGKHNVPADIKESLRVLAKLREAPWYHNEARELPRSSYEAKDGSWHSITKDAPRFSYDGRERNHLSFESRDTFKFNPKAKELPRLSLDSRERSMQGSTSNSKPNYLSSNLHSSGNSNDRAFNAQSSEIQKRPPSVVAKLMGLEALPDSTSACDSQLGSSKVGQVEHNDRVTSSLKINDLNRPIRIPKSPRNLSKDPTSPRWKTADVVMKPKSSSRVPIEPAPWRQLDGIRCSQRPSVRPVKVPAAMPNSFPSVYSEIEKRLKNLEFKQSGNDLRALKQILEAMQAKGLLESRIEEQASNFGIQKDCEPKCTSPSQNLRFPSQRNPERNHHISSTIKACDSFETYESPIVIMKPAKLIEKSGIPESSLISVDHFASLNKLPSGVSVEGKKISTTNRTAKDQSSKNLNSDKRASSRNVKSTQSLARAQQLPKESVSSSVKSTGSVSPRLQQKKLELEKRSRPPTPPSDSNRPRRQSQRQPMESDSPGGKMRLKSSNSQPSDDQLSQISNDSRTSSHLGDGLPLQLDMNVILESKTDLEASCNEYSAEISSQSPSMKAAKNLKPSSRLEDDGSLAELPAVGLEHRSPVSVLDTSVYRDDTLSPVKQTPNELKVNVVQDTKDSCREYHWSPVDDCLSNAVGSGIVSEISRKKLQNVENLVQKLTRLNSTHDEARTDYIASLCENTNPDHRYISEILLASGLLLRDLGSGLSTFQLHPSGHPINPELFLVLEQTKASSLLSKDEFSPGNFSYIKPDHERFQRKLIFDAVNEILVRKSSLIGISPEPWLKSDKLATKTLSAQRLLKELCLEIEQLQANKSLCSLEDEEDGLKSILWEDVTCRSENWTDFNGEVPSVVLDVERLIFKDLVDEIVRGEAASLPSKPGRRRQLFAK